MKFLIQCNRENLFTSANFQLKISTFLYVGFDDIFDYLPVSSHKFHNSMSLKFKCNFFELRCCLCVSGDNLIIPTTFHF